MMYPTLWTIYALSAFYFNIHKNNLSDATTIAIIIPAVYLYWILY